MQDRRRWFSTLRSIWVTWYWEERSQRGGGDLSLWVTWSLQNQLHFNLNSPQEPPFSRATKRTRGVKFQCWNLNSKLLNERTARSQFSFLIHSECLVFTGRLFRQLNLCSIRLNPPSNHQQIILNRLKGQTINEIPGFPKPPSSDCQGGGVLLHLQLWARPQAFHQVSQQITNECNKFNK